MVAAEVAPTVQGFAARWPAITGYAAAAASSPPEVAGPDRYLFRAASSELRAELDARDASLALTLPALASPLRVRRSGVSARSISVDGAAVAVGSDGGDALFLSSARGVEELVTVREPGAGLRYEVDLPRGFALEHDGAAAITVTDPRGTPVARAMFFSGWDATGKRFAPELSLEHAAIRVTVPTPDELTFPVLIDPEWISAGVPAYPRLHGDLTLLTDGRVLVTGGYVLGAAPSEIYDPVHDVFRALGLPLLPRQNHSATLLRNGKVLLVGGTAPDDDDGTLDAPQASLDVVDPRTGAVNALGSLPAPRSGHTATRLSDGSVLIVGGERPTSGLPYASLSDAYRVAEDGTMVEVGSLTIPRARHTASRMPDGRVVIAGGRRWETNPDQVPTVERTAEIFDPTTNTFSMASGTMAEPRAEHLATVLEDGRLLMGWGSSAYTCNAYPEGLIYDGTGLVEYAPWHDPAPYFGYVGCIPPGVAGVQLPDADVLFSRWLVPANPEVDFQPIIWLDADKGGVPGWSYALLADGTVLGAGAGVASRFDARPALAVRASGMMDEPRGRAASATLADGRVLIVGGRRVDYDAPVGEEDPVPFRFPRSGLLFDPIAQTWGSPVAAAKARIDATATRLDDGRVLVAGGSNQAGEDDRPTELFDPSSETFGLGPALTFARARHTATRLTDGRILIAGGTLEDAHAELFDPATNDLDLTGPLGLARIAHGAVRLSDGRVAILGGFIAEATPTASVEAFDPATGGFSNLGALLAPRAQHGAVLLPSGKILVGGGAGFAGNLNSVELFDPETGASTSSSAHDPGAGPLYPPENGWFPFVTANLMPDGSVVPQSSLSRTALLPSGDLLFMGGEAMPGFKPPKDPNKSRWAQWVDLGASALPGAPLITSYAPVVRVGASVTLHGERFVGPTEGASGDTRQSASDVPIVEWMPLDGGPGIRGRATQWTDTSLTWTVPQTSFHGPGYLWVVTRGKRSPGALVRVDRADEGTACALDLHCESGACADGVCCDRACSGCEACSAAKKGFGVDGLCEALPAGAAPAQVEACAVDPVSTCGQTGFCNGQGACQIYPDGSECVDGAICLAGECTVLEAVCDGDHEIVKGDKSLEDCYPRRCSTETNACFLAPCRSNLECVDKHVCDSSGACVKSTDPPEAVSGCAASREPSAEGRWMWLAVAALGVRGRRKRASPPGRA